MNFDWLDDSLWKPIGKGLSEVDTFVKREMPFDMGWGAPAAVAAAIAAPQILPYFAGAGESAAGLSGLEGMAGAGGLTEGLTQGGSIFVDPTVAGYGEGLSGLGFDTAAEQAAIANSGGLFSGADLGGMTGNEYINSQLAGLGTDGLTQGGAIYVDPTVAGYGENLSSIPGYGFDTAAEQQAMMDSGGAFSSGAYDLPTMDINPATGMPWESTGSGYAGGAADQYGTSIDDFLKEKGLVGKEKGLEYGKLLASALKGMGGQKKIRYSSAICNATATKQKSTTATSSK